MIRIILFVIFLSWHSLVGQTLNDLSFGSDTTFDIVSWNIEWFQKIIQLLTLYKKFSQI